MKNEFDLRFNQLIEKENITENFVRDYIKSNQNIFLYGGGHASEYYVNYLLKRGIEIRAIVDKKRQGYVKEIPIYTFEYVKENYNLDNSIFVISAPSLVEEIEIELSKFVERKQIYYFEVELYEYYGTNYKDYLEFLMNNKQRLKTVYEYLEDDYSRDTMLDVIEGRLTGNLDIIKNIWVSNQYWPQDIITFSENEIVIECGSCDGKTLVDLCKKLNNKFDHIYCFEPDKECKNILMNVIHNIDTENRIAYFEKGTYKETTKLTFSSEKIESGLSKIDNEGNDSIDVVALDDVICGPVTYIKMDIEGAELDTLKGAECIIKNTNPKLAVCIYHKDTDIVNIIEYLKDINPSYHFYIRHHNCNMTETVLYAI